MKKKKNPRKLVAIYKVHPHMLYIYKADNSLNNFNCNKSYKYFFRTYFKHIKYFTFYINI